MTSPTDSGVLLADQNGSYPALTGYVPAAVGRRVAARVLDFGMMMVVAYLLPLLLLALLSTSDPYLALTWGSVIYLVAVGLYAAVALWALIAKGSYPGGVIMGIQNVDVHTGRVAAGGTLLKYLLEGLLSGLTLGIGPLIVCFATLSPGTNRHAIDRMLNIIVIDNSLGRKPSDLVSPTPPVATAPPISRPAIAAVSLTGQPQDATSADGPADFTPQFGAPDAVAEIVQPSTAPSPVPRPAPAADPFGSPFSEPTTISVGGPQPVTQVAGPGANAFIEATPFSSGQPESAVPAPAMPVFEPRPVVVEPPSAMIAVGEAPAQSPALLTGPPAPPARSETPPEQQEPPGFDHTVVDANAFSPAPATKVTELLLDGTTTISLDQITLLGRNPATVPNLAQTVSLPVPDPRMELSKTHLAVGATDGQWWVMDLRSTNGTRLVDGRGVVTKLEPGQQTPVAADAVVRFGSHEIKAKA